MKKDKEYIEVKIYPPDEALDDLLTYLSSKGIDQISVEGPEIAGEILSDPRTYKWEHVDKETFMTNRTQVTFYLDSSWELEEKVEAICEGGGCDYVINRISSRTWQDSYKEHFRPIKINDELVISPSWEKPDFDGERIIRLDPGMAFGTGDHETTYLCLSMLAELGCRGKKVLDIGTGSGILAIAAAKLGASSVLATEKDGQAVAVARENIRLNKVDRLISVREGNLVDGLDFSADIAVANIIADVIVDLSQELGKNLKEGGSFISSGILKDQEGQIVKALEENQFEVVEIREKGEWLAIKAVKNSLDFPEAAGGDRDRV